MSQPTRRLLALLELLQTAAGAMGFTGPELAQRLGVDTRSVRRLVVHLVEMGVPVVAQRGRDGGYKLRPGYKLPPMMFSTDEALALAVGLHAAGALGLAGISPAITSTQAKLERVMPASVRRRLADVRQTVAFDLPTPTSQAFSPGSPSALLALSAAARAQQRVHLHYRGADGHETQRDVDVYGLAYRAGTWYAVGHCHLRRELRSFRLDRVGAVSAVPKSFGRPAGFDVLAYLAQSIAALPRAHTVQVMLATTLARAREVVFVELGTLAPKGQRVQLDAQADDLAWVARELARLPFAFKVVKPAALRREVQALGWVLLANAGLPFDQVDKAPRVKRKVKPNLKPNVKR